MTEHLPLVSSIEGNEYSTQIVDGKESQDGFLAIKHPYGNMITLFDAMRGEARRQSPDFLPNRLVRPDLSVLEYSKLFFWLSLRKVVQ